MAVAVLSAGLVRAYALSNVSGFYDDGVAILSPARLEEDQLRRAYRLAAESPEAPRVLSGETPVLAYVVPLGWYLPDLPIHTEQEVREIGGGHRTTASEVDQYRVLIARPRLHDPDARGRGIVLRAHGLEPVAIARVDVASWRVLGWDGAPDHVIWGDIPMPLF